MVHVVVGCLGFAISVLRLTKDIRFTACVGTINPLIYI